MWETAGPFIKEWIRSELGPETALADSLIENWRALQRFPGLIRRLEARYPPEGGAPPLLPLPDIQLIRIGGGWKYGVVAIGAAFVAAAGMRSEEHTSELQSLMRISYAVFCLKKKTLKNIITNNIPHTSHSVQTPYEYT